MLRLNVVQKVKLKKNMLLMLQVLKGILQGYFTSLHIHDIHVLRLRLDRYPVCFGDGRSILGCFNVDDVPVGQEI